MDTANAEIMRVHTSTTGALVENHQLLTLFKAPQRRRQRAHIHGLSGDVEKMVQDPADFRIEHADILATARHGDTGALREAS